MTDTSSGIAYALERKAEWRREKAERHPEDVRNLNAAEMLENLAAQTDDIDKELLEAYVRKQEDDESEVDQHADSIMNGIGFGLQYSKIDDLIRAIIAE